MEREQTTIRLPIELREKLQQEADEKGISLNALLMIVFEEYANQH